MEFLTRKYDLLVKAAASKGRSVRSGSSNETARAQAREVARNSAAGEINARRGDGLCCGSVEQDCGVDDLAISLKSVATSVPEEAAVVAYDDSVRDVEGADSDVVVVRVHSTPASVAKESLAVIQVTPEAVIEVDGFSLNAADVGGSTDEDSVIRAHSMTRHVAREEPRSILRGTEQDVEDLTSPVARDGVLPEIEVGDDDLASLVAREGGMSDAGVYCPVEENRVPCGNVTRVHSMAIARDTPESGVEVEVFFPDVVDKSGLTSGEDSVIREHSVTSPIAKRTLVPEWQAGDVPPGTSDIDRLVRDDDLAIRGHSMVRPAVNEELMNVRSRVEDKIVEFTSSVAGVDDFPEAEVAVADDLSVRTNSTHSAAARDDVSSDVESGGKGDSFSSAAGVDDPPEDEVCVADDLDAGVHLTSTFIAEEHSAGFGMHEWESYDERSHYTNNIWEQQHLRRCDNEREQEMDLLQMEERYHQEVEDQNEKFRELAEVSKVHLFKVSMSWDWNPVVSEWLGKKQLATTERIVEENHSGRFLDIGWNHENDVFLFEVDILDVLRVSFEGESDVFEAETLHIVPLNDPAGLMMVFVVQPDGRRANAKWDDNISSRTYDRGRQWHGMLSEMKSEKILRCSLCTSTCFHITVRRTIEGKQLERSSIAFERVLRDVKVVADKNVRRRVDELEIEKEWRIMGSGRTSYQRISAEDQSYRFIGECRGDGDPGTGNSGDTRGSVASNNIPQCTGNTVRVISSIYLD